MLINCYSGCTKECGTDEAGRGCLSGPVTAAAVILPKDFYNPLLNDSKQLTNKQRFELKDLIEQEAIAVAFAHIGPDEIDKINILNASILAMHKAIKKLAYKPEFIIVDGNKFKPYRETPYKTIVKGDSKYLSIAAASIIAKTERDLYMEKIHREYPMYDWLHNKGYPTAKHRTAIKTHGITKYHRKSFRLLPDQLKLEL